MLDLVEALGSSLDLRLVLERAYPLLLRLVDADYGALGVSSSRDPRDFEWLVARLPPAFFAAYPEMAAHDFVRHSVVRAPNVVLRDQDMVSRQALETNLMYRRAREVGAPLEQVMAVMLHVDGTWQSGLSLYRDQRRPFTEGERAILQDVTPMFANTVRNCRLYGGVHERLAALDAAESNAEATPKARTGLAVPRSWVRLLTPRQQKVTAAVLCGWDNRLVGNELGCATGTIKKHLQAIFDRLGIPSRSALLARAAAERWPP